jgi:PPK2 family polyphosphate:nucleotide phosphotransferase
MNNYVVYPGMKVNLDEWDPSDSGAFQGDKDSGEKFFIDLVEELAKLQEVLYAQHTHKVLIILQAFDTGGKDGTIRHVFSGVNPQGVRVANFKVPTQIELDHDYLWRVHEKVPGKGEITIFNRSHYEDVLVVRIHNLVPKDVWMKRYDQINNFEKLLVEEGTTILKFFLNIDKKEQAERLLARLNEPNKRWKFNPNDLKERALWSEYRKAYEDAIQKTSTEWAPWYIIPSNRKWYRNLVIASIIKTKLISLEMSYPEQDKFDEENYRSVLLKKSN